MGRCKGRDNICSSVRREKWLAPGRVYKREYGYRARRAPRLPAPDNSDRVVRHGRIRYRSTQLNVTVLSNRSTFRISENFPLARQSFGLGDALR